MIIGDPFDFAVRFDLVEAWNEIEPTGEYSWISGIYEIYIDGIKYPNCLTQTEFRTNLFYFFSDVFSGMNKVLKKDLKLISSPLLNVVEDIDGLFFEKKIISLSSTDIEDERVWMYFFFDDENDFILLKTEEVHRIIKYKRNYIVQIFEKLRNSKEIEGFKNLI